MNQEWLEAAVANDAELCKCLLEQQNDIGQQPNTDSTIESIVDPTDIAMDCSDCDNVQYIVDPQAAVANVDNTDNTVDSPTDIAMDCSDCDNVQSIVDPQATVAVLTDSNDPSYQPCISWKQ